VNKTLLHTLVPDMPKHRRTESDGDRDAAFRGRNTMTNLMFGPLTAPGSPSLISTYQGTIDRLLLSFPADMVRDSRLAPGYRSLIKALRRGTRFVVVHHPSVLGAVKSWFTEAGHDAADIMFVPVPDYVDITDWAEDAYVSLKTAPNGPSQLTEPWEFRRMGDAMIADAVEGHTDVKASQAPLIFQGGNCLVGKDFWLLGRDYFVDSMKLISNGNSPIRLAAGMTPEDGVRDLFKRYIDSQRRLIVVGAKKPIPLRQAVGTRQNSDFFLDLAAAGMGMYQPIFHIDMFITLIGDNSAGRFEVMVGDPSQADGMLGVTSPFALQDVYDRIAGDLEAEGFAVKRNPLVHHPTPGITLTLADLKAMAHQPGNDVMIDAVRDLAAAGAVDATKVRIRSWHHITWNNCLVENSTTKGKHVYLPTFGREDQRFAPIDLHMQNLWQSLGFTVHALDGFNAFARRQGVVHCIKKYLDRGK
jgi:hypothetical protein